MVAVSVFFSTGSEKILQLGLAPSNPFKNSKLLPGSFFLLEFFKDVVLSL